MSFGVPPRHSAHAIEGIAATSHPVASLTATEILSMGGNAMDAAVAASAMLGVVEPMSTGIGGDVFCLYSIEGSTPPKAFNGSGRAPSRVCAERLLENGVDSISPSSVHSVTIPGAVDAYIQLLDDFGSMPPCDVFRSAEYVAKMGFAITPVVAEAWKRNEARLRERDATANVYLHEGHAPKAGDIWKLPELGETLGRIREHGREGFYKGPVAEDIAACLQEHGGTHTLDDFETARGEYVNPISTKYQGYDVYECPPNGQGIIALLMLNILDGMGLENLDPMSPERLHLTLEAGRLAFRDRSRFVADPALANVPVEQILSPEYASALRDRIDRERAMENLPEVGLPQRKDTVYVSVVDSQRNAVSLISSLYHGFGSCILAPKSGVLLQCRGADFVVEPGHPNCIAPGRRPMHTIMPGMLCKEDKAIMPFGVMGGDYQPWGHVHLLQNHLLYGMSVQQALNFPRFMYDQGMAMLEEWVPDNVREDLTNRGYRVQTAHPPLGGGQAIRIDWERGTLEGGSEPRKDGIALGI